MPALPHIEAVLEDVCTAHLSAETAVTVTTAGKRSDPTRSVGVLRAVFPHGFLIGPASPHADWPRAFVAYTDLYTGHARVEAGPLQAPVRDALRRLLGPEHALFIIRTTPLAAGDPR